MTIECSNFSKCGNNTGSWLDPDRKQVSVIFCSQECMEAIMDGLKLDIPTLPTDDKGFVLKYHELKYTHKMVYDLMLSLSLVKVETTPSVGTVFTYVDGSTLKVTDE